MSGQVFHEMHKLCAEVASVNEHFICRFVVVARAAVESLARKTLRHCALAWLSLLG